MPSITSAFLPTLALALTVSAQVPAVKGQNPVNGDVALTYQWVRTNAEPGDCGCFYLNGGGVSASVHLQPRWSAVLESSGEHIGASSTGGSLTLALIQGGLRYQIPQRWQLGPHTLEPFAQVLLGGAHAGGGGAGAGDGTIQFAARMGGAIDLRLRGSFALRVVQSDYDLTLFENGINRRQNNLLLATGVIYRWSSRK